MELSKDEAVQERVMEVARQFFANSNITVNLLPALIAGDGDGDGDFLSLSLSF